MGVKLFTEDFNNPSRDYTPWVFITEVTTNDILLTNPKIGNSTNTSIKFSIETDYISFNYLVSSQSNGDYLRVFIDGTREINKSGTADGWLFYEKKFPKLQLVEIEFLYYKNSSSSSGDDSGYIKNLSYSIPCIYGYLLKDGEDIKYWDKDNSIWVSTGESVFNKNLIEQHTTRDFPNSLNGVISTNPTLLYWSEEADTDIPLARYCKYKAVPKNQVIKQSNDFNIISSIKRVEISASSPGTSYIRFAMSKDGGVTWQKCRGSVWLNVDINNFRELNSEGNSAEEVVAITIEEWNNYLQGHTLIRFAYLLGTELSTDIPKLDMVRVWYN